MNVLGTGEEIAGYRIESLLGRGGMAVVYRAQDTRLGRNVALKLLSPELMESEQFRLRFIRESRLAASLDHPNIVPIYEAGEADGLLYIAMRLVTGTDLKTAIGDVPMDPQRVLHIATQVCNALDSAHSQGLVHRDVKPGNILLSPTPDGSEHVYLTDFGLTKRMSSISGGLTRTGNFLGTIDYVAPEQIAAKPVDPRTDIYALGCVLYECFTAQLPFHRDDDAARLWAHLVEAPPHVSAVRPELGEELDAVVARAMAKAPEQRYPSCHGLLLDLREAVGLSRSASRLSLRRDVGGRAASLPGPSAPPEPEQVSTGSQHPSFPPGVFDLSAKGGGVPDLGADPPLWSDSELEQRAGAPPWEAEPASSPAGAPTPERGRSRWLLPGIAGTLALVVVGLVAFALLRPGGDSLSNRQQRNQLVPFSFSYPGSWSARTDNIHHLVTAAPDATAPLFLPGSQTSNWGPVRKLLDTDAGAVVGMYSTFSRSLVDPTNKADLQTLLPQGTEFSDEVPQDANVGGLPGKRLTADITDPRSGDQLSAVTYAVHVTSPQSQLVLLTFFAAPGELAASTSTFDEILGTVSFE